MSHCGELIARVRACRLCEHELPLGARPVVQVHPDARILIAGQAPGRKVHETGIPFDDPSGTRLREWLGITSECFYDPHTVALLPMGFCYPGTGKSGDLPPRPECAATWRQPLLDQLPQLELTLLVGQYAQAWHLGGPRVGVTARVREWRSHWPGIVPLPHPSPRNNRWLAQNPWFESDLLPELRIRVREIVSGYSAIG